MGEAVTSFADGWNTATQGTVNTTKKISNVVFRKKEMTHYTNWIHGVVYMKPTYEKDQQHKGFSELDEEEQANVQKYFKSPIFKRRFDEQINHIDFGRDVRFTKTTKIEPLIKADHLILKIDIPIIHQKLKTSEIEEKLKNGFEEFYLLPKNVKHTIILDHDGELEFQIVHTPITPVKSKMHEKPKTSRKYKRISPPQHAADYKNRKKNANGVWWISKPDKNGVFHWKRHSNKR
jgi:hypothetical protein